MSRSKLALAALTLVIAALASTSPLWAYHMDGKRHSITFEDMRRMRTLYSSLLPVHRLRHDSTAHYLHLRNTLKMLTTSDTSAFGINAGQVNFRKGWHPKPYTTDYEDHALFQLGLLGGMGHFTMVNATTPEMRDYAVAIVKMLSKITGDTKLADLAPQFDQVAQGIGDPSFVGGPSKILDQYDALVIKLADSVEDVYLTDGFWYYTAGVTLAGTHSIPGHDWFNAPYYRDMLCLLYNHYPTRDIPYTARYWMVHIIRSEMQFHDPGQDPDEAQRVIWALMPSNAPM